MSSLMTHLKRALRNPILHVLLGAFFLAVFTWPFIAFEKPIHTWMFLYGSWALAIGCAFVVSQGSSSAQDDHED